MNPKSRTAVRKNTIQITMSAVMAALICVVTAYILHIPLGAGGGYIHLGDTFIYIAACILPAPYACLAAAIGGGFADLLTAPAWTAATVIIKALVVLPFTSKKTSIVNGRNIIATAAAGLVSIAGYALAQAILFGWESAIITSVAGNLIQAIANAVCFIFLGMALDKTGVKRHLS